jgi:hypothetical protein
MEETEKTRYTIFLSQGYEPGDFDAIRCDLEVRPTVKAGEVYTSY